VEVVLVVVEVVEEEVVEEVVEEEVEEEVEVVEVLGLEEVEVEGKGEG